jgi:N-acetylneuraminate lyase
VFVCGTTGEFTSLTTEERKLILKHWVKAAEGRFKVIAHVGSDNQRESVELSRNAAEAGAWGVGSIAPGFFKPSTVRDLIGFLSR